MENKVTVTVDQAYLDEVATPAYFTKYISNIGELVSIRGGFAKVRMHLADTRTGEEITSVINVIRDRAKINAETIEVRFEGGQSRDGEYAVDYMIAKADDVELYAERPAEDDDDWTEDLENEILRQAREAGIRTELLEWPA